MDVLISKDKKFISISFYKIDYDKISIFIDKGNKYFFNNCISTNEFIECIIKLNQSLLISDNFVDKEIETLSNRKVLIGIDLGENHGSILINRNNRDIQI